MVATVERFSLKPSGADNLIALEQDFSATGSTDAIKLQRCLDGVLFQLSGTATSFEAVVERCTRDPGIDSNWAPAEDYHVTGNLVTGVAPLAYYEPARAYWRLRIISIAGGTMKVSLVGEQA